MASGSSSSSSDSETGSMHAATGSSVTSGYYSSSFSSSSDPKRGSKLTISPHVLERIGVMIESNMYPFTQPGTDRFTERYKSKEKMEPLAEGAFGKVYKVTGNAPEPIAVKVIALNYKDDYRKQTTMSNEDSKTLNSFLMHCQEAVLQSEVFDHPNVVKIKDKWIQYSADDSNGKRRILLASDVTAIRECLERGEGRLTNELRKSLVATRGVEFCFTMDLHDKNLYDWLIQDTESNRVAEKFLSQIAEGLQYVHDKGYIHIDLKPKNILLKLQPKIQTAVLADFGSARVVTTPETPMTDVTRRYGTPPYNAVPDATYSTAVDMWAVGLIAYELGVRKVVTRHELFELVVGAKSETGLVYDREEIQSDRIRAAVDGCLQVEGRWTATQLVVNMN